MHIRNYIIPLLFMLLVGLSLPAEAQNKSKKQLEKERTQLEAEIKKLNSELAKAKKNTKLNASQLAALNKKIKERNKLIDNINGQLSQLDAQISQTNDSAPAFAAGQLCRHDTFPLSRIQQCRQMGSVVRHSLL